MSANKIAALLLVLGALASGQTKREFDLKGDTVWIDTNLDVGPGDTIRITATGTLKYADAAQACDPGGLARGWRDLIRQLPFNEAGRGAVVGRIGASEAARPFLVGARTERPAPVGGRLYIGVNQGGSDHPDGAFHVVVETVARPKTVAAPGPPKAVAPFPQSLLDKIPTRVVDAQGTPGDRVNFILIGSERAVTSAFAAAGWSTVDRTNKDAIVRGLLSSLSKQAYVTLPMSELMMFGRAQDYGYAQGDPVRVVASRHHFRIWKAPFTLQGQTVWAGAGTHDIGFDRDQRNNGLTHKIDPDTDKEREYIGESLRQTGVVVKTDYVTFTNAVKDAKTAHGEAFESDGRTLLIYLQSDETDYASRFADLFCSVLKQGNPDGGEWGSCDQYIDGAGRTDVKLGPISTKYRVAIVPGLMSSCFSDAPAFLEGQTALKQKYGLAVDLVPVPNDSSEDNAKLIAKSLRELAGTDPRKFILVGYSKGAPDVQVALAKEDGVAGMAAAVVSVAGAVGGSPIADVMPKIAERYVNQYQLQGCKGDLAAGFRSLKSEVRNAFLASYPRTPVPAYSVVAKADKTRTSKTLMETFQLLTSYGAVQDGQLLRDDAVYPEAKYLGAALADHFAIALPFEKSNSPMKAMMDKNRYPRAALLEAIVRFVTADLDSAGQAQAQR